MLIYSCASLVPMTVVIILQVTCTQSSNAAWCEGQIYSQDRDHNSAQDPSTDKYPDNAHVIEERKTYSYGQIHSVLRNEELYFSQSSGRAFVDYHGKYDSYKYWVVPQGEEKMEFVSRDKDCSANYLRPSSLAGVRLQVARDSNGTIQLGKPSDIFSYSTYLQKQVYVDTKTVPDRGFPANHFQTCHYNDINDTASLVDWYFTDPGTTTMPGRPDDTVLVMTESRGVLANGQTFHTRKDYTHFTVGVTPSRDRHYELPNDVFCHSPRKDPSKPLPGFPKDFRFKREVTIRLKADGIENMHYDVITYISTFQVYIEESELPPTPSETPLAQHITRVFDFNTGQVFRLDKFRGMCSVTSLFETIIGVVREGGRMATGQELMMELSIDNYSFLDVIHLDDRSMKVDAFSASGDNAHIIWYFANKEWMRGAGYEEMYTMPVRKVLDTSDLSSVSDYFAFTVDTFAGDIPDISSCFSASDIYNINMTFNGSYDRFVLSDPRGFEEMVILSLMLPGLGTPLRLSSFDIRPLTTDSFSVLFKLLSVHPSHPTTTSLSDNSHFFTSLQTAARSGHIWIAPPWIKDQPKKSTAMSVTKIPDPSTLPSASSSGSVSTDIAAGVGIACLVTGLIVGVAVAIAIKKYRTRTGEVQLDLTRVKQPVVGLESTS